MKRESPKLVVVGMLLKDNKVWLEQHQKKQEFKEFWQFPGGKVEKQESLYEALARELKEELDILVQQDDIYELTFAEYSYNNKNNIVFYYVVKQWQGNIISKENQTIKLFNVNHLTTLKTLPFNNKAVDKLLKIVDLPTNNSTN